MALINLAFMGGLCVLWCGLAFCKSVFECFLLFNFFKACFVCVFEF